MKNASGRAGLPGTPTARARRPVKAVILDLDGVIVSTDEYHYQAWQKLADEEGIHFDRAINERLRGVSRMESLAILLERSPRTYTDEERRALADRKNGYYRESLGARLTPRDILPGVMECLDGLRANGIKLAVASSSKNSPAILDRIGLGNYFDAVADGNDIRNSKPDPEVFLLAASRLGVPPDNCVVVEDAQAGIDAAIRGGMRVVGVGFAAGDRRADLRARNLAEISVDDLLGI